jgi:hypothetical protein
MSHWLNCSLVTHDAGSHLLFNAVLKLMCYELIAVILSANEVDAAP